MTLETAPQMHSGAQGEALARRCDHCGQSFSTRRPWGRFCKPACRNEWHRAMHPEAVREARELVRLALEGCDPVTWNPRARKLLGIK